MAKIKSQYVCQNCGYTTAKWLGKCPECGNWDSLAEEAVATDSKASFLEIKDKLRSKTLDSIKHDDLVRL